MNLTHSLVISLIITLRSICAHKYSCKLRVLLRFEWSSNSSFCLSLASPRNHRHSQPLLFLAWAYRASIHSLFWDYRVILCFLLKSNSDLYFSFLTPPSNWLSILHFYSVTKSFPPHDHSMSPWSLKTLIPSLTCWFPTNQSSRISIKFYDYFPRIIEFVSSILPALICMSHSISVPFHYWFAWFLPSFPFSPSRIPVTAEY